MSKRVIASYIIDWVVVIIIAAIAGVFSVVDPHYHAFSVVDLSISYPLVKDTVPIWLAGVVAGVVPAIIIPVVCFLFVPGRTFARARGAGELFRLKLWEWHVGWLGLAMSLASAVMITEGLKNFGKPRPNALARCMPDLDNIDKYRVGGYGQDISPRWVLVTVAACTQPDRAILNDGFQSWPSGHSSASWAGLLYLTLFLCSKFAVVLPYLPVVSTTLASTRIGGGGRGGGGDINNVGSSSSQQALYKRTELRGSPIRHRDEAAAPPVYMLFAIFVPVGGALYIACSRYMDYAHHGFDIISGSLIGIVCAYVSFRWYHLPIARGSGWSWGPRSATRAFGVGVGHHGYVDNDEDDSHDGRPKSPTNDVELGLMNSSAAHQ